MKYSLKVVGMDGTIEIFSSDSQLIGRFYPNGMLVIQEQRNGNVYDILAEFKDGKYWRIEEIPTLLKFDVNARKELRK